MSYQYKIGQSKTVIIDIVRNMNSKSRVIS
jgi:hypothetical protein